MTAEELRSAVRRYADEHHPGRWLAVSVNVLLAAPVGGDYETLVVLGPERAGEPEPDHLVGPTA